MGTRARTVRRRVDCETAIIGGGLAGLSTAYHLAKAGAKGVLVIEQEKKLGGHSSGRNAGMIRQALSDPVLARLAKEGCDALRRVEKKGWKIGYRERGSVFLASGREKTELKAMVRTLKKTGVPYRWIDRAAAARLVPVLRSARYDQALYCPTDAMVDIEALLAAFMKRLSRLGAKIFLDTPLRSVRRTKTGFLIKAGDREIFTKRVVNAAGAWAALVAREAGATAVPMKAYRRHLFEGTGGPRSGKWPFVWDLSAKLYFRPLKKGLLLSPCDKALFVLKALSAREAGKTTATQERRLRNKLDTFSPVFRAVRFGAAKAGLRTMTADGRFVIGEDAKVKNFFWVAGLGGHGVTTSFSVGRLAADLIRGRKHEIGVAPLLPARFLKKKGSHAS